jgi:hypothetical protein
MKLLLSVALPLLLALTACSGSTESQSSADPTYAAIIAHLKQSLADPGSYQPAHWGQIVPFEQREVDAEIAAAEQVEYKNQLDMAKQTNESYLRLIDMGADEKTLATSKHRGEVYLHRADSVSKLMAKLKKSTDSTQLGKAVWHAFRAKNKTGALVLDSALFIVFNDGKIAVLNE